MDLMERTNERRRNFQKDRLEHKLDDAVKDKIRLEEANELLKQELVREQRDRDHMWSALEKGMRPQRSRFRRFLLLGAGVGAAYVYGAKAGRGRYDEIVSWWDRMRGRASELQTEAQRKVGEQTERMTGRNQGMSTEMGAGSTGVSASSPSVGTSPTASGTTGTSTGGVSPTSSGSTSRSTQRPSSRGTSTDATPGESR